MAPLHRYLTIAFGLVLAAAAILVLERALGAHLEARGPAAAQAAAERAREAVADGLLGLERELIARAEHLATRPALRAALEDPQRRAEAIRFFERLRLPDGYAVELFTPLPEAIAWAGPVLPLDPATRRLQFLRRTQSAIVEDGAVRQALAVWVPVRQDGRLLGAVRVVRLLRVEVPVENAYLRPFDLFEQWAHRHVAPVIVALTPPGDSPLPARTVYGVDGEPLVYLSGPLPDPLVVADGARREFRLALAFVLALLMGWGMFGLTVLTGRRFRRALHLGSAPTAAVAAGLMLLWLLGAAGFRYGLLALGVPAGFAEGVRAPPAFDPAFIGSGFGGGIAGSAAELALTALFFVGSAVAAAYVGLRLAAARRARLRAGLDGLPWPRWLGFGVAASVAGVLVLGTAAALIHRATKDATIGYFERAGPLPEALVLLAFSAFLLIALAALVWMAALALAIGLPDRTRAGAMAGLSAVVLATGYLWGHLSAVLPPVVGVGAVAAAGLVAWWTGRDPSRWMIAFSSRGVLLATVLLTVLIYPVVHDALQSKDEARLIDAVRDFADGDDPRIAFALESVLLDARASESVRAALAAAAAGRPLPEGLADSLAADLVTGSLLAALADYRVGLTLHRPDGRPLGQFLDGAAAVAHPDPFAFGRLRRLYEQEASFVGFAVERRPAAERGSMFRYAGIGPVRNAQGRLLGWITARAEPRPARYLAETPFPRVLVPAGLYRLADEEWVLAEFEGGILHRSRGASFGRFRLPAAVEELPPGSSVWRTEQLEGQSAKVLYWRVTDERVIAARIPVTTIYYHLYYMLRILLAGLLLAGAAYGLGALLRRARAERLQRPRLRDRVLNRFLLVGLLAVLATGVIGREIIVTQNREAVEERLRRNLDRVEAAIHEEIGPPPDAPVPPTLILDRARPDAIGARLGLDVNLYRGPELAASSRGQLVRQRLIEPRLPIEVVRALFVDGQRYAFATERIGRFTYTTGFEAIPDEHGHPAVVIAVPTLPEQFAIEADQARMIAYLFGVLLLLLLLIFVIATVLASRLTRPFRRLREGLRAVGAGQAPAEPIPVESRDEVGEVIETFNAVWDQLEESRQKLAAQERELAWREMARQVAHEIKNPLTPMRLSVQHLRRAYARAEAEGHADGQFGQLLDQISGTLIEQIDALNRIAGEFSTFGRLPERALEVFDVNEVIRQAAALVGEEPHAAIMLRLSEEPLPVRADREELRRVYINLLKNAQQAIPEGERGLITVTSTRRRELGEVAPREVAWTAVRDNGVGIPESLQPRIFQPNFSTKTRGMGLGLAIARKTIEDVGGEIGFDTQPGLGTTFYVKLDLVEESGER